MPSNPIQPGVLSCLGLCSWSLQPGSVTELVERVTNCQRSIVQLALEPLRTRSWRIDELRAAFDQDGIRIASAMMATIGEDYSTLESIHTTGGLRPDAHWHENKSAAIQDATIAMELGVILVTFHAGFLPEDPHSSLGMTMLTRLREIAEIFARRNIRIALETGQESASTLVRYLNQLRDLDVGVNFDAANMLLYASGDPIASLKELLPYVVQVHIKDARRTRVPGAWGEEVRVGDGEVHWPAFLAELATAGRLIPAMIEREAGDQRIADIRHAADFIRSLTPVS